MALIFHNQAASASAYAYAYDHHVAYVSRPWSHQYHVVAAPSPPAHALPPPLWYGYHQQPSPSQVSSYSSSSWLWQKSIPSKICSFLSKLLNNDIPVDHHLKESKGISMASQCQCCHHHEETIQHLFVDSPKTQLVWRYFEQLFHVVHHHHHDHHQLLMRWFTSSSGGVCQGHVRVILPILVLWFIWLERNEAKHQDGVGFSAENVIWRTQQLISQLDKQGFLQWRGDHGSRASLLCSPPTMILPARRNTPSTIVRWSKPDAGKFKLNVDGSVHPNDNKAGGGGVIRDSEGNFVVAFAEHYDEEDGNTTGVLKAESRALVRGLELCLELGINNVWVEMDSLVVVNSVLGSSSCPMDVCYEVNAARDLLQALHGQINHIYREGNSVADYFANYAVENTGLNIFESSSNTDIKLERLLESDKIGLPYLREH